jgi:hypothetical protein
MPLNFQLGFNCKCRFRLSRLAKVLLFGTGLFLFSSQAIAQDPPSKQYGEGEDVPLVWILAEWHEKHPQIPLYLCVCTKGECDNSSSWPFRRYSLGEVRPALGPNNRADAQTIGFSCGQVSPNELQGIGG